MLSCLGNNYGTKYAYIQVRLNYFEDLIYAWKTFRMCLANHTMATSISFVEIFQMTMESQCCRVESRNPRWLWVALLGKEQVETAPGPDFFSLNTKSNQIRIKGNVQRCLLNELVKCGGSWVHLHNPISPFVPLLGPGMRPTQSKLFLQIGKSCPVY